MWEHEPRLLLINNQVPWSIQAALASYGYRHLQDLAHKWDDPAQVRKESPAELGFKESDAGWTPHTSRLAAIRLANAVEDAKLARKRRQAASRTSPMATSPPR